VRSPYHSVSAPPAAGGFLGYARDELVDLYVVGQLRGVGDGERGRVAPPELSALDALFGGDDVGACLAEYPMVRRAAVAVGSVWTEAVEDAQRVEALQSSACRALAAEVQPRELFGREDVVLVAVERDLPVAVGQVGRERNEVRVRDPWSSRLAYGRTCRLLRRMYYRPSKPGCQALERWLLRVFETAQLDHKGFNDERDI
jgi:hypothetical protein